MSGWELAMWWGVTAAGFAGCALYAGLETGAYSLNRVRLQIREHQGRRNAQRLRKLLANPTVLLTTLLIGTNVTSYACTAAMTVLMEDWGLKEWQIIIAETLIVTPLLFIFAETLPKDLFSAHSDRLMYRLTPLLDWSRRLFTMTGLLPLIGGFTALMFRSVGAQHGAVVFHPRRHVEVLVREGVGHGVLSDEQSAIVERVWALSGRRVRDEMVPWSQVATLKESDDAAALRALAQRTDRSRFPVVDAQGRVTGVVNVVEALLRGPDCPPLAQVRKSAFSLDAQAPLREALGQLQTRHEAMAIVTEHDRPVGIVTVKDLVEPITGELASW